MKQEEKTEPAKKKNIRKRQDSKSEKEEEKMEEEDTKTEEPPEDRLFNSENKAMNKVIQGDQLNMAMFF